MRIGRMLLVVVGLAGMGLAQTQPVTGTIAATAKCVSIQGLNNSAVGIIVSGTWSGTLTPNVQISTASSAPTIAKKVVPVDSTTAQATITANGGYLANVGGFAMFNVCSTGTWTSGTVTITLYATPAPNNSTTAASGGGSGTVTSVSVVTANGLSGSVANPTSTPAITLSVGAINLATATGLPLSTGVTGQLPISAVGSAGLSGTSPITISAAGVIACATCNTSSLSTGTLVNGDYVSATGAAGLADSTVVAGPYAGAWYTANGGGGTPTTGGTANRASVWGVNLAFPLTTTTVSYSVVTGDTSGGTYDLGLYTYAGVLAAHTGNTAASTAFTATGVHTLSWTGTAVLQPGKYFLALTCSATSLCATFVGQGATALAFVANTPVVITSGGTLSTPITPPADSVSFAASTPAFIIK